MNQEDGNYTFELRQVGGQGQGKLFVIMKKRGLAFLEEFEAVMLILENSGMSAERARTMIANVRGGQTVRYYEEEGKMVVLFDPPSEEAHAGEKV